MHTLKSSLALITVCVSAGRKRKSELSDGSKLMLEDAVFQLISHHQDTDELLKEVLL